MKRKTDLRRTTGRWQKEGIACRSTGCLERKTRKQEELFYLPYWWSWLHSRAWSFPTLSSIPMEARDNLAIEIFCFCFPGQRVFRIYSQSFCVACPLIMVTVSHSIITGHSVPFCCLFSPNSLLITPYHILVLYFTIDSSYKCHSFISWSMCHWNTTQSPDI